MGDLQIRAATQPNPSAYFHDNEGEIIVSFTAVVDENGAPRLNIDGDMDRLGRAWMAYNERVGEEGG